MSKITFLASPNVDYEYVLHDYYNVKYYIDKGYDKVATTNLSFLSFDLLDSYEQIELFYLGKHYVLKLGKNSWTNKELKKEHNLLKLVRNYILEK